MNLTDVLRTSFESFTQHIIACGGSDLFALPYAEYTHQCYLQFSPALRSTFLAPGSPAACAMLKAGVIEPDEQLLLFICTHYLALHAHDPA